MKKKLLLSLLFILLILPAACRAASQLPVYVTPAEDTTGEMLDAVRLWQKGKKTVYLFLPSGWDTSSLRIWHTDGKELTVNGTKVASGELIPGALSVGDSFSLRYGKASCTVQVMQSTGLPSVHITTASGSNTKIHKSKKNEETGSLRIEAADGTLLYACDLTQVRCRGNSSFKESAKKSYQIKLEKSQDLFGMGKSNTWVLVAGFRDRSFIRTRIALDMASYAGLPYTP